MKGLGIPEIIISVGLILVLLAGFLPGGSNIRKDEILLLSDDVGQIGSGDFTYRHIPLTSGIVLAKGVDGTPLITQKENIEVAKGILTTEEHTVQFSIPANRISELESANLLLDIRETNKYGPLIVVVNGVELFKEIPKTDKVEVNIPLSLLEQENAIKISSGSSGWRIWAPTTYKISELKVMETLTTEDSKSFTFSVDENELKNFYIGRIYMGSVKPHLAGEITIILNNENVVYRGLPGTGAFMASFSSGIRKSNSVEIKLLESGYYEMKNIDAIVFTQSNLSSIFTKEFQTSASDLAKLRDGELRGIIEVEVAISSGDLLQVTLSGESDTVLYRTPATEGLVELGFSGNEVSSTNRIIIESPGVYEIKSLRIKLVKV